MQKYDKSEKHIRLNPLKDKIKSIDMFKKNIELNFNVHGNCITTTLIGGIFSIFIYIFLVIYISTLFLRINNSNFDDVNFVQTVLEWDEVGDIELSMDDDDIGIYS